jgi:hypothetical protein
MADELNKPLYNKYLKFPKIKDVGVNEITDGEQWGVIFYKCTLKGRERL